MSKMDFQIGNYVTHPSTGRPNKIKQIRISKGVRWLGFGSNTIGWVKADDCAVWNGPKVFGGAA
ncbi:hypothetical protein ACFODO_09320 [Acinetobacter sichuanensis]|uniref:Uncharacterized protein n=1 Tax=Acinetobacter sichuanensis TaxID=2136183 RepID=A0ABV7BFE1_9GAMM